MPRCRLGVLACNFLLLVLSPSLFAKANWTELNVGPFFVDTDGSATAAREALTQLEQTRWVLGGLLEDKNLRPTWPIRVMLTDGAPASCSVSDKETDAPVHAQYLLVCRPGARMPLGQIAQLLLDANTPRLPPPVESGLHSLFATLEARGSRVTWGGAPPHPDLDWARMQLFATKFEYGASFHIFLTALKGGSTLRAAEQNAFGQPPDALEKEAAARLEAKNWPPVATSGRPLDPKRDFGEHSLNAAIAQVYLADATLPGGAKTARQAYQDAVEAGGIAAPLGHEGLAKLTELNHKEPEVELENAVHTGSRSAPVYLESAVGLPPEQAIASLKKAEFLNPLWAEPVERQAELTEDPKDKEELLKKAIALNRRDPQLWIALATVQSKAGEATAAQGSWLRAEDAAPTPETREQVHQQRLKSEDGRIEAVEKARDRERNATYYADQKAQQRESRRIAAAEKKANSSLAAEGGEVSSADAIPWGDLASAKKMEGSITRVDCAGKDARLTVKDTAGRTVVLLLQNVADASLSCGNQKPPKRVSLTYSAGNNEQSGTSGTVISLDSWRTR